ncbi:MAG TPA: PHP domain-containing protein [Anaerolineae bacterium]|nr:PHP domain-containing protein [Anaerolineae bacterium]HPL30261.1 PHP domain-containing protein [Anaerolineae bacterium]
MLRARWADLHLHTVLSPCAEVEMIPPLIVRQALALGLDWIAVTDHNSAGNVRAMVAAAEGTGLAVTPGLEVESREEVHLVCLFDTAEQAEAWGALIAAHLPPGRNDERFFGAQYLVDAQGEYLRTEERLLLTSTDLTVEEIVQGTAAAGGVAIPAHVDRPNNSLLANLGFVPQGLDIPGLEISRWATESEFRAAHPDLASHGLISSGDAHRLSEMLRRTAIVSRGTAVTELVRALRDEGGCGVVLRDT